MLVGISRVMSTAEQGEREPVLLRIRESHFGKPSAVFESVYGCQVGQTKTVRSQPLAMLVVLSKAGFVNTVGCRRITLRV